MELNKTVKETSLILLPVIIFIAVYFLLGLFPNYKFGTVDTEGVYNLEKALFGMTLEDGTRVIPSEYFRIHHWAVFDVLSGLFYLCWVPLPFIYAIVLYFQGRQTLRGTSHGHSSWSMWWASSDTTYTLPHRRGMSWTMDSM